MWIEMRERGEGETEESVLMRKDEREDGGGGEDEERQALARQDANVHLDAGGDKAKRGAVGRCRRCAGGGTAFGGHH